jgi:hypothetical protein
MVVALVALAAFAGVASAQSWSPEQQEVWAFEERQWKMSAEEDLSWIDTMVHPNLSYWDTDRQLPQGKASLARWSRFGAASSNVLEQEIFPISLTITGNVAVAHYGYVVAREDHDKKRQTVSGRYTDVLLKEDGKWRFIAWAGGDDPEE